MRFIFLPRRCKASLNFCLLYSFHFLELHAKTAKFFAKTAKSESVSCLLTSVFCLLFSHILSFSSCFSRLCGLFFYRGGAKRVLTSVSCILFTFLNCTQRPRSFSPRPQKANLYPVFLLLYSVFFSVIFYLFLRVLCGYFSPQRCKVRRAFKNSPPMHRAGSLFVILDFSQVTNSLYNAQRLRTRGRWWTCWLRCWRSRGSTT